MVKKIAVLLVTLVALFWAINFYAGKIAVEHLHPLIVATIRFVLASVFIVPILLCLEPNLKETIRRHLFIYILLGFIGVAAFNSLFFEGLKYTSPVNAALVMATNPVVTMLLAAIILKDRIRLNHQIGMLLSLIGVVIVVTHGSLGILLRLEVAVGDVIMMAANLCWALYSVLVRRYLKESKPLVTTAATIVFGSLILMVCSFHKFSYTQLINQSIETYSALIFMATFGSALAYLFWNYGIEKLGPGNTSLFFNLIPVFTVFIAVLIGQPLMLSAVLGGSLVIIGVLISAGFIKWPLKNTRY